MAVEDMNGEVRFSPHLPYPNNLSRYRRNLLYFCDASFILASYLCVFVCVCIYRPLLEPTESLLQMLLLWDPAARGGGLDPDTNKPSCYSVLQNILNMKVIILTSLLGGMTHPTQGKIVDIHLTWNPTNICSLSALSALFDRQISFHL